MQRQDLEQALAKPLPERGDRLDAGSFDPWEDIIHRIHGSYSSECDQIMIETLKAVRDGTTFEFIEERGLVAELAIYVLSGHGFINYGTSPRGGWPEEDIENLWQTLIDKWEAYAAIVWVKP